MVAHDFINLYCNLTHNHEIEAIRFWLRHNKKAIREGLNIDIIIASIKYIVHDNPVLFDSIFHS